jgi:hypothetical protein
MPTTASHPKTSIEARFRGGSTSALAPKAYFDR